MLVSIPHCNIILFLYHMFLLLDTSLMTVRSAHISHISLSTISRRPFIHQFPTTSTFSALMKCSLSRAFPHPKTHVNLQNNLKSGLPNFKNFSGGALPPQTPRAPLAFTLRVKARSALPRAPTPLRGVGGTWETPHLRPRKPVIIRYREAQIVEIFFLTKF